MTDEFGMRVVRVMWWVVLSTGSAAIFAGLASAILGA